MIVLLTGPATIKIKFTNFEIEGEVSDGGCYNDYIMVGDDEYCGSEVPVPYQSTGNSLNVFFWSDDNEKTKSGFQAVLSVEQSDPENVLRQGYYGYGCYGYGCHYKGYYD